MIHRIINLDLNYAPLGDGTGVKKFTFPSGCEQHIKIDAPYIDKVYLTTRIRSADDIMYLLLATDAVRRLGAKWIGVVMPYLPYARQDRVMDHGEPLSLKVFADLINSQKYNEVLVTDPHSDVSTALLDNVKALKQEDFIAHLAKTQVLGDIVLVSPDAGALKKIYNVAKAINYGKEIVLCNKVRDVSTGRIIRVDVGGDIDLSGKDCLIVDDIIDGGATFEILSTELRNRGASRVFLAVTHGIFSKGFDIKGIDHIFTTDSFQTIQHEKVTQICIKQIGIQI